jgi:hypothetical protein
VRVQALPSNCPRCEALASFRPRHRPIEDNYIEVFIRCPVCHYEQSLRVSTPEIEHLRKILERVKAANRYTVTRHGVPSSVMTVQERKLGKRIRELEREIP